MLPLIIAPTVEETDRSTRIHATDAAKILGVHRWGTQNDPYLTKVEKIEIPFTEEQKEFIYWGNAMEEVVAKAWAERNQFGFTIEDVHLSPVVQHPKYEWMACSPDRLLTKPESLSRQTRSPLTPAIDTTPLSPKEIVECAIAGAEFKNTDKFQGGRWTDEEIPEEHLIQIAWCTAIFDFPGWHVAVLVGGNDLRIYYYERDLELEDAMINTCGEWHERHIVGKERPPVDGSPAAEAILKNRYPTNEGPIRAATDEEMVRLLEYRATYEEQKERGKYLDVLKQQVKEIIAESSGVEWDDAKVTYKKNKDSEKTDYKTAFTKFVEAIAVMKDLDPRLNAKELETLSNECLKAAKTTRPGARVLRPSFARS